MPGGVIDGVVMGPGDGFSFMVSFVAGGSAAGGYAAAVQIEAEKLLGVPVDVRTAQDISRRFRDEVLREAVAV